MKSLHLEYELDLGYARVKVDGSGRRSRSFLLSIVSEEVLGPTGPDDYCVQGEVRNLKRSITFVCRQMAW